VICDCKSFGIEVIGDCDGGNDLNEKARARERERTREFNEVKQNLCVKELDCGRD
jgi:hypothetical protein